MTIPQQIKGTPQTARMAGVKSALKFGTFYTAAFATTYSAQLVAAVAAHWQLDTNVSAIASLFVGGALKGLWEHRNFTAAAASVGVDAPNGGKPA